MEKNPDPEIEIQPAANSSQEVNPFYYRHVRSASPLSWKTKLKIGGFIFAALVLGAFLFFFFLTLFIYFFIPVIVLVSIWKWLARGRRF